MSVSSGKEKIVALSLDIEDKGKVISLLERKVELVRSQLHDLDDTISQKYQRITQEKAAEHKKLSDDLNNETQNLMKQKSELIKSCKEYMELIQDTDRDMQAEIRGVYREGDESIESERKLFKQGYDDRLSKFMALKAQEYRESTNRAMDPEFKRLQAMHEHDMARLKLELETEERRLQENMKQRYESMKEEEKKATKEELRFLLKAIQDKCEKDLDELSQEFKQKDRLLRAEHVRQMEKHQKQLKEKATRSRHDRHQELNDVHESGQERLLSMKQKHSEMLQKLTKDHEQKIRTLKRDAEDEKRRLEMQFHQHQQSNPHNNNRGSPSKQKRPLYRPKMDDTDYDDDFATYSPSRGSSKNSKGTSSNTDQDNDSDNNAEALLTPAQREELARLREEQESARDQQLQSLIRSLELETVRIERDWKQRIEKEEKKISELTSKEHEQLSRRIRQINDDITEYVVERENIHRAVQDEKQKEEKYEQELAHLRQEIVVYEEGIAAHRSRLQEKTQQHQLALRGIHLEYAPQLRDMQQQITDLQQQMHLYVQRWEEDQEQLEEEHGRSLADLDRQVKEDVSQLDVEIMALKEDMEEEKVKQQRLQVLLAKYGGGESVVDHDSSHNHRNYHDVHEDGEDEEEEELHVTKRRLGSSVSSNSAANKNSNSSSRSRQLPKQYQQEDAERQARLTRVGAALAAYTNSNSNNIDTTTQGGYNATSPTNSRRSAASVVSGGVRRPSSTGRIRPNTSGGISSSANSTSSAATGVRSRIVNRRTSAATTDRQDRGDDGEGDDEQHTVYTARTATSQRTASTASNTVMTARSNSAHHNLRRSTGSSGLKK